MYEYIHHDTKTSIDEKGKKRKIVDVEKAFICIYTYNMYNEIFFLDLRHHLTTMVQDKKKKISNGFNIFILLFIISCIVVILRLVFHEYTA